MMVKSTIRFMMRSAMSATPRATGAENVLWDLSVYYNSQDDPRLAEDLQTADQQSQAFMARYRGQLAALDGAQMAQMYAELEALQDLCYKPVTYAELCFSTQTSDPAWGAFLQKMRETVTPFAQRWVFVELEWLGLDDAQAQALLAQPDLAPYRHQLQAARRYKPHRLSEAEEKLLIETANTGVGAWTRLFDQIMAHLRVVVDGESLTLPRALKNLYDQDRGLRQRTADSITEALRQRGMELSYIYNTVAADKAADDKRRGYPHWLSARNLSNKAPDSVVNALVQAVTARYDLVARHYSLKRQLMGLDELFDYDRYAPLNLKQSDAFYTWEEARDIVLKAFNAFSPAIGMAAARFFQENWIHAPVLEGKRGGAYASPGLKSTHPVVFVNFQGTARDVMTLAHELGHGVHMLLTSQAQTLSNMYPPLTTSEMASTFAEMMVFQDLLARESDDEVKLGMLAAKIEDTMATVFRQVAMNRFEDAYHSARRTEGELSHARLSELWMTTQRQQFGDSVTLREPYSAWWSYIPHFLHTPGYVYAYAFGELLVLALFNLYQRQGHEFILKYEALLAAGDSANPDELLARVGVDLNDPAFWQEGLNAFAALVEQEAELAKRLYPERTGAV
jgi:oligoendopeptidase F